VTMIPPLPSQRLPFGLRLGLRVPLGGTHIRNSTPSFRLRRMPPPRFTPRWALSTIRQRIVAHTVLRRPRFVALFGCHNSIHGTCSNR
jgi:hypothetical protein